MDKCYDCIIVGAGMAGLLLANALVSSGFKIAIIEKKPPLLSWGADDPPLKVSALHQSSLNVLRNLEIASTIDPTSYCPLRSLQVWDDASTDTLSFNCIEVGASQLGWIVENRAVVRALWQALKSSKQVDWYLEHSLQQIEITTEHAIIMTDQAVKLYAKLLIGADGAHSPVRTKMNFKVAQRSYQHTAIVGVIGIEESHQQVALQHFMKEGPLGILPLRDKHQCSIVWSSTPEKADYLMQLSADEFNLELSNALGCRLGDITLLSARHSIPLIRRHAHNYVQPRVALIGDAAHTIHPLAGQGANLGFMDVATLATIIEKAHKNGQDIGSFHLLRKYERARKGDNQTMHHLMQSFKDIYADDNWGLTTIRSLGLKAVQSSPILKKKLINYAMGYRLDMPPLTIIVN